MCGLCGMCDVGMYVVHCHIYLYGILGIVYMWNMHILWYLFYYGVICVCCIVLGVLFVCMCGASVCCLLCVCIICVSL